MKFSAYDIGFGHRVLVINWPINAREFDQSAISPRGDKKTITIGDLSVGSKKTKEDSF